MFNNSEANENCNIIYYLRKENIPTTNNESHNKFCSAYFLLLRDQRGARVVRWARMCLCDICQSWTVQHGMFSHSILNEIFFQFVLCCSFELRYCDEAFASNRRRLDSDDQQQQRRVELTTALLCWWWVRRRSSFSLQRRRRWARRRDES